jgi:phage FluMu protein Com|tara:strand:- start:3469 stop:3672 length:204 start_codon:yes stop_codon:yes gene_type:complete
MSWLDKFKKASTTECFYCYEKVDKKTAFSVKLNTAEGQHIIKACPKCADEVNEVLKAIEEVKNDPTL